MLRRSFVRFLVSGVLFALLGPGARRARAVAPYAFLHGVASGDPLIDGIILWTRVSGAAGEDVSVSWQLATDLHMRSVVQRGVVITEPGCDYTVKVDVRGLQPGRRYYYRFAAAGVRSEVGRTRTLPVGRVDSASFAVVSCSNYPTGYFYAYRDIARRDDLDAVIHLGDYIYEYGPGEYGTEYAERLGRVPDPAGEAITLADYRRRHAQYKSDPDSQAMHAAHPVIAVWDDHELVNDTWNGGAQNHNEGEGDFGERIDAAIRAYLEWLPVRAQEEGAATRIFRDFRYGDLLALIMLDTRFHGRHRQPVLNPDMSDAEIERILGDPSREMLGWHQVHWLRGRLRAAAGTTWQVIGQQVMVSTVHSPNLEPLLDRDKPFSISREALDYNIAMSKRSPPLLVDTWDGYDAARQRLFADVAGLAVNPVFLSGDLHTSLAGDLVPAGSATPVAVEFMTPSITSPGFADYLPERYPGAVRDATLAMNPNLAYMETDRRGWLRMTLTHDQCIGEWHLLDGVRGTSYSVDVDQRLAVGAGRVSAGLHAA